MGDPASVVVAWLRWPGPCCLTVFKPGRRGIGSSRVLGGQFLHIENKDEHQAEKATLSF
jgi:hypothetical protein